MALVLNEIYSSVVEESMRIVDDTLSEKDRRRYVAVEALKLGWGGQTYLASVVGCSRRTVANGISELQSLADGEQDDERIRRSGGGRVYCQRAFFAFDHDFPSWSTGKIVPHVTRACQGVLFDSLETVMRLMRKTATQTGLSTTVHVMKKVYETGRKATDEFRENLPLKFDSVLPRWNYTAVPQAGH